MPLLLNHRLKEEYMETVQSWTDRDLRKLDEIIVEGERRFKERQPRSGALIGEARGVLAGGATSSWQIARPQMIWVSHGAGSYRQGRGLLSRASRLGHGLGLEREGRDRAGRTPLQSPFRDGHPAGHYRPHLDRPLQRPRRPTAALRGA